MISVEARSWWALGIMETYEVSVEEHDFDKHGAEWFYEAESSGLKLHNVEIWRDENGLIHRENGPAVTKRDEDGQIVAEGWYSRGNLHRDDDMPAAIWTTSQYLHREWYQHGIQHRDAGPANLVTTTDTQREKVFREEWYQHGKRHRVGGPARLMVSDWTGVVMSESWYRDGKYHRVDGPACIQRNEDTGVAYEESWLQNGQDYRANGGPTFISRNEKTGEIFAARGSQKPGALKPPSP